MTPGSPRAQGHTWPDPELAILLMASTRLCFTTHLLRHGAFGQEALLYDSTYVVHIQAALDGLADGTYKTIVAAAKTKGVW